MTEKAKINEKKEGGEEGMSGGNGRENDGNK